MSKRIKHVYTSGELPHVWVRNNMHRKNGAYSEDYPKPDNFRASNVFTDGRFIYSYGLHFCIAAFHPVRNDVVFVTNRSYSSTTSKHQRDIDRALPDVEDLKWKRSFSQEKKQTFKLGTVTVVYCEYPESAVRDNRLNVEYFARDILAEISIHADPSKRPHTKARAYFDAMRHYDSFLKYAKFAAVKSPFSALIKAATNGISEDAAKRIAAFLRNRTYKGEATKALKKYEARRKELETGREERSRVAREKREAKLQEIREEVAKLGMTPEAMKEFWRRTGRVPSYEDFGAKDYSEFYSIRYEFENMLRDSGELLRIVGKNVVTSRSASVPLDAAKLLYNAYISGHSIHGKEIGGFTVLQVDQGGVKIGCHFISRPEIENFGRMIEAKQAVTSAA